MGSFHIIMEHALNIVTTSPEATERLGIVIGQNAQPGDIFLLTGELGSGKTCLTQGIATGAGIEGNTRSPTFVLMTQYQGRMMVYHADLYRINDPLEAWDIGLYEQLTSDGISIVEWADKATEIFPDNSLWINLGYCRLKDVELSVSNSTYHQLANSGEELRQINIDGAPPKYTELIQNILDINDREVLII